MKLNLREYQQNDRDSIREAFRRVQAVLYVLPTGGGKTVVFTDIAEKVSARGKRCWTLVHRKELLNQGSNHLAELGVEHGLISSGRTMTGDQIQVASVQTLVRRLKPPLKPPDLLIIDEAHHAVAGSWEKIIEFCGPKTKILGVTATPERADGKGLGRESGGPFDVLVSGPSIASLIEQGYLSPPIVYAPPIGLDMKGVKTKMGDYDKRETAKRVDQKVITGNVVGHYQKICPGAPAIAFCASIAHAKNVASQFNKAGIAAAYVSGDLDQNLRDFRIQCLGDGRLKVLASCDIVSEGTDIPVVTTAILLRPTKSEGLYLQQVGRCLRTHENKEFAIVLDHVGNCFRHGLPDDLRNWTLNGRRGGKEISTNIRQCKTCYAVYSVLQNICPQCETPWKNGKNGGLPIGLGLPDEEKGELEAVNQAKAQASMDKKKEVAGAQEYKDLVKIAEDRNYKPGWAVHVWNSRCAKRGTPELMV